MFPFHTPSPSASKWSPLGFRTIFRVALAHRQASPPDQFSLIILQFPAGTSSFHVLNVYPAWASSSSPGSPQPSPEAASEVALTKEEFDSPKVQVEGWRRRHGQADTFLHATSLKAGTEAGEAWCCYRLIPLCAGPPCWAR